MSRILVLIATAAALSVAASPAFATSKKREKPAPPAKANIYSDGSLTSKDPNAVIVNGKIIGSDPDPRIRLNLWRGGDPANWDGD